MKIAILGGTGDIGEGLALRLAADTDHEVTDRLARRGEGGVQSRGVHD